MGSYAALWLGAWFLGSNKDDANPDVMFLFSSSDKVVQRVDHTQPTLMSTYLDSDDTDTFSIVKYSCSVKAARDRLELMGFTRKTAEASFYQGLNEQITWSQSRLKINLNNHIKEMYRERVRLLQALKLEDWLYVVEQIRRENLKRVCHPLDLQCKQYSPLLHYMLCNSHEWYGFPGNDARHFLRLVLDICYDSEELIYDLTDLILGGWAEEEEDLVNLAKGIPSPEYSLAYKRIVLTEGDTDKWILERSLKLLYPHIAENFHFFDFTGAKLGGGAGELARLVKAFAAAGTRDRVIALFDNNTAGEASINSLSLVSLPKNIAVRRYPNIQLAENYPTLGPAGMVPMNVNGLASSIEVYLGDDVLRDEQGNLSPIQWRGYDVGLGRYQGEILKKNQIQARFDKKLRICESDPSRIKEFDWDGINAILETMRTAFHELDASIILDEQRQLSGFFKIAA